MSFVLHHARMELAVPTIAENSICSVVCDPPYELDFMGKHWDRAGVSFQVATWAALYRVLKPGGYLLAFGGTRTHHRMVCAIEDAGFEIRDEIDWVYASGFPKSLNLDGAWDGWGTALKPAKEPVCVARKPLIGTVQQNLDAHRVGAINIAACRVPFANGADETATKAKNQHGQFESGPMKNHIFGEFNRPRDDYDAPGRWPTNIILDGSPEVLAAFPDTYAVGHFPAARGPGGLSTNGHAGQSDLAESSVVDSGSAARFFYCAKASKSDRDAGCQLLAIQPFVASHGANAALLRGEGEKYGREQVGLNKVKHRANIHPTVKPTALMRYLVRLVTPPGGTVLDWCMGSGSTGRGAVLEGCNFIGIEQGDEYMPIARARIADADRERVAEENDRRNRPVQHELFAI
jgi:site-specific DNA-methyltransferase (adenine-specific)